MVVAFSNQTGDPFLFISGETLRTFFAAEVDKVALFQSNFERVLTVVQSHFEFGHFHFL